MDLRGSLTAWGVSYQMIDSKFNQVLLPTWYPASVDPIPNNLALLRKEKGLTQAEVAYSTRRSLSAYCKWEQGKIHPNRTSLHRLAKVFKCPIEKLGFESPDRV
jgi:DNA-binding XRE family transcriptional regulator